MSLKRITCALTLALMIHGAAKALSDNYDECNYISNMSQVGWSQEANNELETALKNSDPESIRAAIWGGADPSKLIGTRWYEIGKLERLNILLISAVGADNLNNVRRFLAQGADPNAEGRLDEIMTPLITASYCASPAVIELLIHSGAEVNAHAAYPGGSGEINENSSALIWASYRGDPKIVKLLLK